MQESPLRQGSRQVSAIPASAGPSNATLKSSACSNKQKADKPVHHPQPEPFPPQDQWRCLFPRRKIAPCPARQAPTPIHVIRRKTRWGHKDLGCDAQNMMQMEPVPCHPPGTRRRIHPRIRAAGWRLRRWCSATSAIMTPATIKKGATIRVSRKWPTATRGEILRRSPRNATSMRPSPPSAKKAKQLPSCSGLQSANAWYENDSQRMKRERYSSRPWRGWPWRKASSRHYPRWVMQANTLTEKQPEPLPQLRRDPQDRSDSMCELPPRLQRNPGLQKHAHRPTARWEMDRLTHGRVDNRKPDQSRNAI